MIDTKELKERVSVIEVAQRLGLDVKVRGSVAQCLCPFHTERTGSLTLYHDGYHCFGCKEHGDVFKLVQKVAGTDFRGAVEFLLSGLERGSWTPPPAQGQTETWDEARCERAVIANLIAGEYFRTQLKQSPAAQAYLRRRGVSAEIEDQFGLGYAPRGSGVLKELEAHGLPRETMIDAGLLAEGQHGDYSRFRSRIMIPLLNAHREPLGFMGRHVALTQYEMDSSGDQPPRYLNTPASPVFQKSSYLFGAPQAEHARTRTNTVVAVEGPFDVLSLHSAGVPQAVGILGSALSEQQAKKLLVSEHVVLLFDNDSAGKKGMGQTFQQFQIHHDRVVCLMMEGAKDPSEFALKHRGRTKEALLALRREPVLKLYVEHGKSDEVARSIARVAKHRPDIREDLQEVRQTISRNTGYAHQ